MAWSPDHAMSPTEGLLVAEETFGHAMWLGRETGHNIGNLVTATAVTPLVLVIEDEIPIRQFLRNSLNEAGYRLAEADSGHRGLAVAEQTPPDVVLLDLGLPDIDGQEVLLK